LSSAKGQNIDLNEFLIRGPMVWLTFDCYQHLINKLIVKSLIN
jgi:hypothetical protein